jgi:hypothetical protein
MKTSDKKSYDCVKSVRKERERIAEDTAGMTPKEILEYFEKRRKKAKKNMENSENSEK